MRQIVGDKLLKRKRETLSVSLPYLEDQVVGSVPVIKLYQSRADSREQESHIKIPMLVLHLATTWMSSVTLPEALLSLRDFLIVWISQIIYYNHIYPDDAFSKKLYLDLVVYQCRAPALNEYIQKFIVDMLSILVEKDGGGKVHDLVVLLYDEASLHVRHRYIANFSQFSGLKGQLSSLDFLSNPNALKDTHSARINIPYFTRDSINTNLRSLMFFHLEELKRSEAPIPNDLFYKFLLNVEGANLNKVLTQPSPRVRRRL